jgi:hypothetical protein
MRDAKFGKPMMAVTLGHFGVGSVQRPSHVNRHRVTEIRLITGATVTQCQALLLDSCLTAAREKQQFSLGFCLAGRDSTRDFITENSKSSTQTAVIASLAKRFSWSSLSIAQKSQPV